MRRRTSTAKPPGHPERGNNARFEVMRAEAAAHKPAFLEAYETEGTISAACKKVGISTASYYNWVKTDPQFVQDFRLAHEKAVDMAESELRRRGIHGYQEPVFYKGEQVAHVRRYSDACLIFYLKGRRGDVFRERTELTGADGGPVQLALVEKLAAGRRRVASASVDAIPDVDAMPSALPALEGEVVQETPDANGEG